MVTDIEINNIEISGEALIAFVEGLPDYLSDFTKSIMYQHKIADPKADLWYCLEDNIMALDELQQKFGKSILYEIGKSLVDAVKLGKEPKGFKEALEFLEFNINNIHKNGLACKVEVLKCSLRRRKVILSMETPYPFELIRGVITGMARKYTPHMDALADVEIDEIKSEYPLGFYKINW